MEKDFMTAIFQLRDKPGKIAETVGTQRLRGSYLARNVGLPRGRGWLVMRGGTWRISVPSPRTITTHHRHIGVRCSQTRQRVKDGSAL